MSSHNAPNATADGKAKENTPRAMNSAKEAGQSAPKDPNWPQKPSSSGADGAAAEGKAWDKNKQDTWLKCLNDHR
ncbi:MAG: hypothetical protein Q9211_001832 [Gyalolechia sp. 1 TL-2023]